MYHLSIVLNISYISVTLIGTYQISTESPLSHLKLPQASKVNETQITSHNYIIIEMSNKKKKLENKIKSVPSGEAVLEWTGDVRTPKKTYHKTTMLLWHIFPTQENEDRERENK